MSRGTPFDAPPAELPAIIRGLTPESNVHYEHSADGAPLVITFGFYGAPEPAAFTFLGRFKKLELVSGRPINKLLLRDPALRWYLGGIDGVGPDLSTTVEAVRELITYLQPSAVITVGQSMGAYAAMMFGTMLGVDKVVSFGPVSAFEGRVWDIIGERRWGPVLAEVEQHGLGVSPYNDLPVLIESTPGPRPDIDLIYGNFAGAGADPTHAVSIDGAHAMRFANNENVALLPVAYSEHAVVEYFRARGVITEVLSQRIFGTSLMPTLMSINTDPNVAWLLENIGLGSTFDQLRPPLLANGTPAEHVEYCIDRAQLALALIRLQDTPPTTTV